MDSTIPKLSRGSILFLFLILEAPFSFMLWSGGKAPVWFLIIVSIIAAILFLIMTQFLTTVLSDEGVSQWTWRGKVFIRWKDVHSIRFGQYNATRIVLPFNRILIAPIFYHDYVKTTEWLRAHLAHVWPSTEN